MSNSEVGGPINDPLPREFFFVLDRPHCLWSHQAQFECGQFLSSLNAKFYARLARQLCRRNLDNARSRAEAGGTARIFWHHAVETFVTLVGAAIQAPTALPAYFALCRNEDVREIAELIQARKRLPFEATVLREPGWAGLFRAVFEPTPWHDDGQTVAFYVKALQEIIVAYLSELHRLEYNALKHGMRVSIGSARLEFDPAKGEPIECAFSISAQDASHLAVIKPVESARGAKARIHHQLERVTIGWSLERTIQDLDLLSGAIDNLRNLLTLLMHKKEGRLRFVRVDTSSEAHETYFARRPKLSSFVLRESFKPTEAAMPSADEMREQFAARGR